MTTPAAARKPAKNAPDFSAIHIEAIPSSFWLNLLAAKPTSVDFISVPKPRSAKMGRSASAVGSP
ncbi:hypothetical protein ALQ69_200036 [Pseudomonas savastanoi pv. glycinea]|nr:hypothetical protein ALQ69_200036 [Pseudomonas savastanoi pv. glycinea]